MTNLDNDKLRDFLTKLTWKFDPESLLESDEGRIFLVVTEDPVSGELECKIAKLLDSQEFSWSELDQEFQPAGFSGPLRNVIAWVQP